MSRPVGWGGNPAGAFTITPERRRSPRASPRSAGLAVVFVRQLNLDRRMVGVKALRKARADGGADLLDVGVLRASRMQGHHRARFRDRPGVDVMHVRSEGHTSELQSLMR